MAKDEQYSRLMEYLRALRREGATFVNWLPDYKYDVNGKPTGKIKITVEVQEKT